MSESTVKTQSAVKNFYKQRKAGVMRSTAFYADLSGVSMRDVKDNLDDISARVTVWPVKKEGAIKEFVERKIKPNTMQLGTAFYQLSKREEVQDYKLIVIRHKISGKIYGGTEAKTKLELPHSCSH